MKKEVADIILDKSKDTIYGFYNELEKDEKEADLYDAMEQVFENAIKEFGIDEKRMLKVAQTIKPNFVVEDGGDLYYCNVVFEDEIFTLGTVPKNLTEQGLYKEALKATIAATVLFDRAFPDDENKNPLRSNYTSDLYHDLINQLQTS